MLLILISWIYIFFTSLNFGSLFCSLFKLKECHLIIKHLLGLFFYGIIVSTVAFFFKIHIAFYLAIFILNVVLTAINFSTLKLHCIKLTDSFFKLTRVYKWMWVLIFVITLAQSATLPYLLDNETYYIQTIKWLNEYGYVKGLANLHMFLGQNSSWHAIQAGFNFPFISPLLNDLNGFLFVLMGFLFIETLHTAQLNGNTTYFNLGATLLFTLFLMQFVNTPSPDLPIFLTAPYLFYLFIKNDKNINSTDFKIMFCLVVFLCFIKVTMMLLLVLPLVLFIKYFKVLKTDVLYFLSLGLVALTLFVCKNMVISGYPFYPLKIFSWLHFDWKVPVEIIDVYRLGTYLDGMSNIDTSQLKLLEKIKIWLFLPKLDGLFNKAYALLLLVFPLIIWNKKHKTAYIIIYLLAIAQLIILWFSSPQYRFFFVFVAFMGLELFSFVIKNWKLKTGSIFLAIIISAIPVFVFINLNAFTNNTFVMELNTFKLKSLVYPEKPSKTKTHFTKVTIKGFEFLSPDENVYFWITGDGPLPCVNKKQIEYFKTYYKYIPELRSKALKDGFISKKID